MTVTNEPIFKLLSSFADKNAQNFTYSHLDLKTSPWVTPDPRFKETNTRGVNPVFTILRVALNAHRTTPFLLRPNKSARLLKLIVALAIVTVSSSWSDVNSDILSN